MMKFYSLAMLLPALILGSSLKPLADEPGKDTGAFYATVDGKEFKLNKDQLFKGTLISKSGSMDGRTPGHTVISAIFNGPSYDKKDGSPFNESVQFEIGYEDQKLGKSALFSISLQYQSTDYSMIPEQCKLSITRFAWEEDHKHFLLSADFEGKMRSWGYPGDGKKDISLKGKISNIRITAPSYITSKK